MTAYRCIAADCPWGEFGAGGDIGDDLRALARELPGQERML